MSLEKFWELICAGSMIVAFHHLISRQYRAAANFVVGVIVLSIFFALFNGR